MTLLSVTLIALIKTAGEGGTVQLPYANMANGEAAGATLQAQFEALPLRPKRDGTVPAGSPQVLYTCLPFPVQD